MSSTNNNINNNINSIAAREGEMQTHPPGFSPPVRESLIANASGTRPNTSGNPRHRNQPNRQQNRGSTNGSQGGSSKNRPTLSDRPNQSHRQGAPLHVTNKTVTENTDAPPGFPPAATAREQIIPAARPPDLFSIKHPSRIGQQNSESGGRTGGSGGSRSARNDRDAGGGSGGHYRFNQGAPNNSRRYQPKNYKNRVDHAGVRMTGNRTNCLICCQQSDLYGLGSCLHPMCMECAIRVRILGESNSCPQCRMGIETLYFVHSPPDSGDFKLPQKMAVFNDDKNNGIKFESDYAIECFKSYMSHKCQLCCSRGEEMSFSTFSGLHQHMNNIHQLTFCYLCSENVNVLTKDRKTYTRQNLLKHMNGDGDQLDEGFQGHPKCLFCDLRFYDDEAQYKHLRKDHYFCQICDADGATNIFFKNHYELTRHYKRSHIPCDNKDCEAMGIVFRTEVELNVHKAKQHSGQAGGQRPVQLDFQFSRNPGPTGRNQGGTSESHHSERHNIQSMPTSVMRPENVHIVPSAQATGQHVSIVRSAYNPRSSSEFPQLETRSTPYGAPPNWRQQQQSQVARVQRNLASVRTESAEQFPSLAGGPPLSSNASKQKAESVWAKGNTKDLFGAQANARAAAAAERAKRRPVVPMPDIWPEGMQEKLRLRELGLPDPDEENQTVDEPEPKEKKTKKKKSKTVPINAARDMNNGDFIPSSSKFELLSVYDEASEMDTSTNWWSKAGLNKNKQQQGGGREQNKNVPILRPTSDDFVRIELANSDDDSSSQPTITLRSIAMGIDRSKEDENVTKKSAYGGTEDINVAEGSKMEEAIATNSQPPIGSGRNFTDKLLSELFVLSKK